MRKLLANRLKRLACRLKRQGQVVTPTKPSTEPAAPPSPSKPKRDPFRPPKPAVKPKPKARETQERPFEETD